MAEILNGGRKVAILVGSGARGAAAELEQVAELLGAGVAKALLGKDVLSDQARAVQIDLDPVMIGMRYPYEVNLVGDAATTLRALIPLLVRKDDRSWREGIESEVARWWETMTMEAAVEADPINPMRLFAELSPRLPDNAIVTADSGSSAVRLLSDLHDALRGQALDADESLALITELAQQAE